MSQEQVGGVPAVVSDAKNNLMNVPDPNLSAEDPSVSQEPQGPLTAVNLNRTFDAKRRAREIAERKLNEKLAESGFLKRWILGSPGRAFMLNKYEKAAMEEIQNKQAGGESEVSDEEWLADSDATMERMTMAGQNQGDEAYSGLVHEGESLNVNKEATEKANEIISEYAQGGMSLEEFSKNIEEVREILRAENGGVYEDNFLELANTAKARFEHGEGVESIMRGFQVLNAEVRDSTRTEAHRTAIDKMMDGWNSAKSRLGVLSLIPEEVIIGAAGVAMWAMQSGTRNVARAIPLLGSMVVGGAFSAMREGSRVQADRQQRLNELAQGRGDLGHNRLDDQIAETAYDMKSSNDLMNAIGDAMKSDNSEGLMKAVLEAEAYISRSDSSKVDHIKYSSPDKVASERWALDLAIAQAKASLPKDKYNEYKAAEDSVYAERMCFLEQDENTKDAVFKKLRRKRMLKVGATSAVISGLTLVAGNEIRAAFDDKVYGLADGIKDHFGGGGGTAEDGKSLLAGVLGLNPKMPEGMGEEYLGLTADQVKELGVNPLKGDTITAYEQTIGGEPQITTMNVDEAAALEGSPIKNIGWANNGTAMSDLNELHAGMNADGTGWTTWMDNNGSMIGATGERINFSDAVANNQVVAYVTLKEGTLPIKLPVNVLENGQVEFIPEPGSAAAAAFEDGEFKGYMIEIAKSYGTEDGVDQLVSLAAERGTNTVGDTIEMMVEPESVTETLFNVVKAGAPNSGDIDIIPGLTVGGRLRNLSYDNGEAGGGDEDGGEESDGEERGGEGDGEGEGEPKEEPEELPEPKNDTEDERQQITGPTDEPDDEGKQITGPVAVLNNEAGGDDEKDAEGDGIKGDESNDSADEAEIGNSETGGEMDADKVMFGPNDKIILPDDWDTMSTKQRNRWMSKHLRLGYLDPKEAADDFEQHNPADVADAKKVWEGLKSEERRKWESIFDRIMGDPLSGLRSFYWPRWKRISEGMEEGADGRALFTYWYKNVRNGGGN